MEFKAQLLLCNHVEVHDGLLFIHGGGRTLCPPQSLHALACTIEVPWHRMNEKISFNLDLLDADGNPVVHHEGGEAVRIFGEFEVGRPPGMKPGSPALIPLAFNTGQIVLAPEESYVWKLEVNGQIDDHWQASFRTSP